MQPDLFQGQGELAIDATFGAAHRTMLDSDSWVDVVPAWVFGSEALLHVLADAVPWKQHHRRLFDQTFLEPRMTAFYRSLADVPHAALVEMAAALSRHYRVKYDSIWLNLYRDGRDSTGWHRDRFSCRRPDCIVPVVTLGATRRFLLKPRHDGTSIALAPRSGDLIVMGGRCQEGWLHGVPKSPGTLQPRISLNFQSSAQAHR